MNPGEVSQLLVNGLVNGSYYGLLAVGFGLILGVTGRFHFAYATTFILAAYFATSLVAAGLPLYVAILAAIAAVTVVGVAIERFLYRPLVERNPDAALLAVFVSALGVTIVAENAIRLIWGSTSRSLGSGFADERVVLWGETSVTTLAIFVTVVSVVLVAGLAVWMRRSRRGRAIRAVRANPDMARAVGIDPNRVYLLVFAIGSALSGVAGILFTMRYSAVPEAAMEPTFNALVIAFLAGLGASPLRFAVAGLAIGLIESLATLWISGTWSPIVTFGVLFVYIAVVPLVSGRGIRDLLRLPRPGAAAASEG